jgi:hypothetical protein
MLMALVAGAAGALSAVATKLTLNAPVHAVNCLI